MKEMTLKENWVQAFHLERVPSGRARVLRRDGKQIAVFRIADDTLYAVDNLCPHEGYPLAQGGVKGAVLTCAWHNFKFDLRDGRCCKGDENVAAYPCRVVGGMVEVDVAGGASQICEADLLKSLEAGLLSRSMGRVARDVVRLLRAGVQPGRLLAFAAAFDGAFAEYGATHALPLAADCFRFLGRYQGVDAARPIMQAMDMASEPSVRRPRRLLAEMVDPGFDSEVAGLRFRQRVEEEDVAAAEGLLRGALQAGWGRSILEPWFFRLCTDHFLDSGHALIYQIKLFDLLEKVGWSQAEPLLCGNLFRIVNGTREDTLPNYAVIRKRLDKLEPQLPELMARQRSSSSIPEEMTFFVQIILDGKPVEVFDIITDYLENGVSVMAMVDGLSVAASDRILRFDNSIDLEPSIQEGWLHVTHLLTFCNATRRALERYDSPDVLKLLFYGARQINAAKGLDLEPAYRPDLRPEGEDVDIHGILEDITTSCAQLAVTSAATYVAREQPMEFLWELLEDFSLSDPATRPIVVAHIIKTLFAAREEFEALEGHPRQAFPLLALVRFLASPRVERRIGQLTVEAINLVAHGRVPRRLTG